MLVHGSMHGLTKKWMDDMWAEKLCGAQALLETDSQTTAFNLATAVDTESGRGQGSKAEG